MPILETHTYIPQLFWLIVSFLLLYFLLSKFCIPQLTKIFQLRDSAINGALERASIAQAEAVRLRDDYESKLAEATKARNAMIANAVHELNIEIEKRNAENDIHFAKKMKEAEKELKNFEIKSRDSINTLAKEAAKDILKDFLKLEISDDLISNALEEASKTGGINVTGNR